MTGKLWQKLAVAGIGLMAVIWHGFAYAYCEAEIQAACRKANEGEASGRGCYASTVEQAIGERQELIKTYTTGTNSRPDSQIKMLLNDQMVPYWVPVDRCVAGVIQAYWAGRKSDISGNVASDGNSNSSTKPKKQRTKDGIEYSLENVWEQPSGFNDRTFLTVYVTNYSKFTITCRVRVDGTDSTTRSSSSDQSTIMLSPGARKPAGPFQYFDSGGKVRSKAFCEKSPFQ